MRVKDDKERGASFDLKKQAEGGGAETMMVNQNGIR